MFTLICITICTCPILLSMMPTHLSAHKQTSDCVMHAHTHTVQDYVAIQCLCTHMTTHGFCIHKVTVALTRDLTSGRVMDMRPSASKRWVPCRDLNGM